MVKLRNVVTRALFKFTVVVQVPLNNWTITFLGLVEFKLTSYEFGESGVRFILRIPLQRPTYVPV